MQKERRRQRRGIAHLLIVLMICTSVLPLQTVSVSADDSLRTPSFKEYDRNGTELFVRWGKVSGSTGYQVQYADNRVFIHAKKKSVSGETTRTKTLTGLDKDKVYYVRVRAVKKEDGHTTLSGWRLSPNAETDKTVGKTRLKAGLLKKFELRRAAKQKVPGFDTVQGSCYAKGYAYFILENRNIAYSDPRCKIVKVRLSNRKVVKVSGALKLRHGNDMTFDTKRNRIVVSHSTPSPKMISVVDPVTLKVIAKKKVKLARDTYKLPRPKSDPDKYYDAYNGFGNIAYNSKYDQFVCVLRGKTFHHLLFLDSNFNPVRFQYVGTMAKQMLQGIDTCGDYILVGQSYGYGYTGNNILIYDWDGNYNCKLNLGTKYELESIFHKSGTFYASFYTSFYKKKLLGNGSVLHRDNYLYELGDF